MKNVLDQKPMTQLFGRMKGCSDFVKKQDIQQKNILDIGCGFGSFVLSALHRGAHRVTGVEVTEGDIATAQKHIIDERANFLVASAIDLPFVAETFDSVVSFDVIEHIPKGTEPKMFSEVFRVLKPGGVFYLSTPYRSFFSNVSDPAWWLAGHRHYTESQLKQFGKDHGLVIEEIQTKGSWWTCLGVLNMYISKWIFRRPPFFQSFFRKKESEEYLRKKGFINIVVRYKKV